MGYSSRGQSYVKYTYIHHPELRAKLCETTADVAEYHRDLSAAAEIITSSLAKGKTKRAILSEPALQTFENWGDFMPVLNTEYWFDAVAADSKENTDFTDGTGQLTVDDHWPVPPDSKPSAKTPPKTPR